MHILTLELPPDFADRLAAMHPDGLDAAVREGLKAYVSLGPATITKFRQDATQAEVSLGSVLKRVLELPAPKPVYSMKDRDKRIIAAVLSGQRRATVAARFDLSLIRIHQIMAAYKAAKAHSEGKSYPRAHNVNSEHRG